MRQNGLDHVRIGDSALKRDAITLSVPPHSGQTEISISKTRLSRCAQVSGAVGKSRSTPALAEAGVAEFFRSLRTGLSEPGTTAFLNGELGAKTP